MDESVDALDAGEDTATDTATGEASDSATAVATDWATEDSVSASLEGDEGDHATEDGLSGPMEEEGDKASADESDIARPTKRFEATNCCKCAEGCLARPKNLRCQCTNQVNLNNCSLTEAYLQSTCTSRKMNVVLGTPKKLRSWEQHLEE